MYRVISVKKIKQATKDYIYYNGYISKGSSYYRGFARRDGVVFEFFFTDDNIFKQGMIHEDILDYEFATNVLRKIQRDS